MKVICVDDEPISLEIISDEVQRLPGGGVELVGSFSRPQDALAFAKENKIDVAVLDIDMPMMTGIELGRELTKINPRVNIIFCTAYSEFALDAIKDDCSGYLLKPASMKDIEHQFSVLRYPVEEEEKEKRITVQCFGNFEIYCDRKPLRFRYEKTKELLAVLIDRKGAMTGNNEIMARLWEDDDHDAYLRKFRADALNTFEKAGFGDELFLHKRSGMALNRELISCDYYDYLDGKNPPDTFRGEYMSQYSWAEDTLGFLMEKYYS